MSSKKKLSFFIYILIFGAMLMSACERSASSSPSDSIINTNETQVFDYFLAAATETAQAANQGSQPDEQGGEQTESEEEVVEQSTLPPPTKAQPEATAVPTEEQGENQGQATEGEAVEEVSSTAEPTQEEKKKELTPLPTSEVSVPNIYSLEKGESPFCIARRFDIDINAILDTNGLWLNQYYEAGLELTLPKNAAKFEGERKLIPHPDTYIAQQGDTFFTIACDFGDVYPISIAEANAMELSDALEAGESIFIP